MQTAYAIKPIKTEADYEAAMEQLEELWDAKPGTPEADQLEVLGILIDQYETQQFPIAAPNAVEAVLFYMEQNGLDRAELGKLLGSRSRASEFLNHKTSLSLTQIRKLNEAWGIPADVLIQPVRESA
ncbi:MAG: transcriptional regulator [Thalassospira sp.]|uniref:helix-turn-helix domain-containing protein n=1 Tax=Thalassospira sp. UBA4513 TaxID=1947675 RepID=UPI000C584230|nr:transcriptional regulator [Thalassospira sp. UBA4513]MBE70791.1 transcriptional regulator [Thalassospira sp.]HAI29582.1 transcriptional regulator [Thalassospira sp.]|tara:strand:- start:1480 stop:1860 length:381 start_codon:yes stop_codon:yes gene_type:complete